MKPNIIAIAVDAVQFPAAAFLADKLASINPRNDTEVVIFSDSLRDLAKAKDFGTPADLRYVTLSIELPRLDKRISGATFFRLFVPEMAEAEVRRIIYLDADTFPEDDRLFSLFDLDMGDRAVAAVRDAFMVYCRSDGDNELRKAGVAAHQYFNAGVLLIDRRRYLDVGLRKRAFAFSTKRGLHDQAALNRALAGNWVELSPAMNMQVHLLRSFVADAVTPSVVHFAATAKPWEGARFALDHPARKETEQFLLASPWKSFLTRHFNFRHAWDALQSSTGKPTFGAPIKPEIPKIPATSNLRAIGDYLRNTSFSDVEQGISRVDVSAIPVQLQPER